MSQGDSDGSPREPVVDVQGVVDTHAHVYGPRDTFPFVEDRRYTPDDALIDDYLATLSPLGVERVVLTQPSVHGLDNRALTHALGLLGARGRGIVMVDENVDDATLDEYHRAGVRGIRTQIKGDRGRPLGFDALPGLATRIKPWGWHIEIHVDVSDVQDIDRRCAAIDVPVVIEHMGHMRTSHGVDAPGFQALLRFVRDHGGWAKLSGAYINTVQTAPHHDVRPFFDALVEASDRRVVWGSNWPHPHQDPLPNDRALLRTTVEWLGDPASVTTVMATNPAHLYGFDRSPDSTIAREETPKR